MTHEFLVLHFGAQCPWQPWVVEQARLASKDVGGRFEQFGFARIRELLRVVLNEGVDDLVLLNLDL